MIRMASITFCPLRFKMHERTMPVHGHFQISFFFVTAQLLILFGHMLMFSLAHFLVITCFGMYGQLLFFWTYI
jgi:hypothetical protein